MKEIIGRTILVTGGGGFIGSHIVDALVQRGDRVIVVDNLSSGSTRNINPRAKFYHLSICDNQLKQVFDQERPEIVIHQAAQTVVTRSMEQPLFDAEQNILGSLNLIMNCLRSGVSKIVYASSGGAIYGEPEYRPVDECHPINPLSAYGVSKHTVEHYLQLYSQYGLDYVVLRYANVYGTRQNPEAEAGVVAIFAREMLQGWQPTIFGSGDKTRDYIHVSDVVAANLLAMGVARSAIYNIGSGVETKDQEIFDAVAHLLDYHSRPRYATVRKGEVLRICLENSKAKTELGWEPHLSFEVGLQQTIDYYRNLYEKDSIS